MVPDMKKQLADVLVGVVLALVAFVFYLVTLGGGAVPGPSAGLVITVLDLFPRLSLQSPFWFVIARGLAALSGQHAVYVLNVFSALCGALTVGLLYSVMRNGVGLYLDTYLFREERRRFVAVLAGAVSAVSLGFTAPFWTAANRAHMMTFDVLLLVFSAWLLVSFLQHGKWVYVVFLCALYGVFAAEFATMIVIGPMFAMGVVYGLWRHEMLLARRLISLGCLVVGGIVVGYLLSAFLFFGSQGHALHAFGGFGELLWAIWRDQAMQISRSLPREGWLIILFTTTVPWLGVFLVARRGLNDERDLALIFLHLIMTAFAGALWVHVPLTPWRLLGWQRLLLTPYMLVAMVSGYLAAFWFLFAGEWRVARETGWQAYCRLFAGWTMALGVVVVSCGSPWLFLDEVRPKGVAAMRTAADEVVASLDGQAWLVTDGVLDAHYFLAAWERQVPLRILSLPSSSQNLYLRYIAGLFDDVRLQNATRLSLGALLHEWLQDPQTAGGVAILHEPDIWRRVGYEPVPQGLVYVGRKPDALPLLAGVSVKVRQHLDGLRERVNASADDDDVSRYIGRWLLSHAGRLANDAGVLMEDANLNADAFDTYRAVLQVDPDNISALLNLSAMVSGGRARDDDGSIQRGLAALSENLTERLQIWSLVRVHGVVRAPEAFAQMGWNWAYSGQAAMAVAQVERAVALHGAGRSQAMEALMAEVYMQDNRPTESAAIYRGMLENPETRPVGVTGLYRIALRERNFAIARRILQELEQTGMPPERVFLEGIMLDLLEGRAAVALQRLEDFLLENRDQLRGWVMMAEAAFVLKDQRALNRALRRIEILEGARGYFGSMIRARTAFAANDFSLAAELYEAALNRRPGHLPLIEELLRLSLVLQRRDGALRHMRALLHADPGHPLALYVRGSLQIADGDYRLAEDSLRRSLERQRQPMALNDLGWLLVQRGAFDEAETLVREALVVNDQQAAVWDTLGVMLMRTGRLEEAEAAFSRAIALDATIGIVHLHQAELQLLRGRADMAREIVERLEPFRSRMSEAEQTLFRRLRQELR
jgi:tetratricopeptide (TPR) repeat protein